MQFLKIHPQLALNVARIEQLAVEGREDHCQLVARMAGGTSVILSHYKDFRSAELELLDLIDRLEALTP